MSADKLIGTKIGNSIITKVIYTCTNKRKRKYYNFQCCCGKTFRRRSDYVTSKKCINPSCGCSHSMKTNLGNNSSRWNGYKEISGYYFSSIKNRAKKKNLEFNITKEFCWNLYLKQNKQCALTKLPITMKQSRRTNEPDMTASLDRIDSNKGYTEDNVQWVHKVINRMKNGLNQDEFVKMCTLVHLASTKVRGYDFQSSSNYSTK